MKINQEYFEFILEYPGYSNGIVWWKQEENPLSIEGTEESLAPIKGFDTIKNDFPFQDWNGLSITKNRHTLLDGTPYSGNYFFSVGLVDCIQEIGQCFIPTNINQGSKESLFWVRIPSLSCLLIRIHTFSHFVSFHFSSLLFVGFTTS